MAIGMGIAAVAYLVMTFGSIGLPDASAIREMGGFSGEQRVSSSFLIAVFFIFAIAELFIYPLLASFISQYARPKHQGLMQSISPSASIVIGSLLLPISITMYKYFSIWATWAIFASVCLISMIILLRILKRVEKILKLNKKAIINLEGSEN